MAGMYGIYGVNLALNIGDCVPLICESENHIKVGPISVWDIKEPVRMTSTLTVTTLRATIES